MSVVVQIDLPADVACPTCHVTGIHIEDHYDDPPDVPMDGQGSYMRGTPKVVDRMVMPCGHKLLTYRWVRVDQYAPVVWTLVPR